METSTSDQQINRKPKQSALRRLLRGTAIALIASIVLIAGFYAVENWRGQRAWNSYVATLKGGEKELQPLRTTEELHARAKASNELAKELQPVAGELGTSVQKYGEIPGTRGWKTPDMLDIYRVLIATTNPVPANLGHEQATSALLAHFRKQDEDLEKLRQALKGPNPSYPFGCSIQRYNGQIIITPEIFGSISLARYLEARLIVELAAGEHETFINNLQLLVDVNRLLEAEQYLIGQIGFTAVSQIATKPIWTALSSRRLSNEQLSRLQEMIRMDNRVAKIPDLIRVEKAGILQLIEQCHRKGDMSYLGVEPKASSLFSFAPDGWWQFEKVNFCLAMDNAIRAATPNAVGALDVKPRASAPEALRDMGGLQLVLNHRILENISVPRFGEFVRSSATAQVLADHIRIACALERFYNQNGLYPENLAAVVPQFLDKVPLDPLSGADHRYALDSNGRYKIWSVGQNGVDDGGLAVTDRYSEAETGDWVWYYPQSEPVALSGRN